MKGKLLVIPTVISEMGNDHLNPSLLSAIHETKHWIVERARTARRFIKSTNPPYPIDSLTIIELETKDRQQYDFNVLLGILDEGHNLGMLSESGCPGVADPGSKLIYQLQKLNFEIIPFVGPSSILMSLMASGLNGQHFEFHGYLPIKEPELKKKIAFLESQIKKSNATQIFIETPYRNDRIFKVLLKHLQNNTRLCIATDITGKEESIRTKAIGEWKKLNFKIGKLPTVFLLN